MIRRSNIVSACIGAAVAGALLAGFGFAPSQSGTGKTAPPSAPKPPAVPPDKDHRIPAPQDPGKPGMVPMPPEMAAAMEFMQPGPEHEWLASKSGNWNMTGKMWMAPDAPPSDMTGKSTFRMILGGRYLIEDVKSSMMGEPFEAMGVTGFNRATKKFQYAWLDTMGTAISEGTSTRSADGKTLTGTFEMLDPMSGQNVAVRTVETHHDNDSFDFAMFGPGPNGAEMKMMELNYRRAK